MIPFEINYGKVVCGDKYNGHTMAWIVCEDTYNGHTTAINQDKRLQKNYFFERAVNPFIFAKISTKI